MEKIVWNFAGRTTFTRVMIGEAKTVTDSPPFYIHTLSDSRQFNDVFNATPEFGHCGFDFFVGSSKTCSSPWPRKLSS